MRLFNGAMPLIAIQMQALKVGEHVTLVFTKVVDVVSRGLVDEEEVAQPTSRKDWEEKASHASLNLVDHLFNSIKQFDPALQLSYKKHYVGLAKDGQADNFVSFCPQKNSLILRVKIPKSEEFEQKIDQAGLETPEYNARFNYYPIRVGKDDVQNHSDLLKEVMRLGYEYRHG